MRTPHSRGPWKMQLSNSGPRIYATRPDGRAYRDPIVVGVGGADVNEARANARLIAEAPALLVALRATVDAIDAGELLVRWSDEYLRENGLDSPAANQDAARAILARIDGKPVLHPRDVQELSLGSLVPASAADKARAASVLTDERGAK